MIASARAEPMPGSLSSCALLAELMSTSAPVGAGIVVVVEGLPGAAIGEVDVDGDCAKEVAVKPSAAIVASVASVSLRMAFSLKLDSKGAMVGPASWRDGDRTTANFMKARVIFLTRPRTAASPRALAHFHSSLVASRAPSAS